MKNRSRAVIATFLAILILIFSFGALFNVQIRSNGNFGLNISIGELKLVKIKPDSVLFDAMNNEQSIEDIEKMIREDPSLLLTPSNLSNTLPLIRAIADGQVEIVKVLLLTVPHVYSSKYLLETARFAEWKGRRDCILYFYETFPTAWDRTEYIASLDRRFSREGDPEAIRP